jgi:hypothetical protein
VTHPQIISSFFSESGLFFVFQLCSSLWRYVVSGYHITVQAARDPPLYIIKYTVKAIKEIEQKKQTKRKNNQGKSKSPI